LEASQDGQGVVEVVEAFIEDEDVEWVLGSVGGRVGLEESGVGVLFDGSEADGFRREVDAEVSGVAVGSEAFLEDAFAAADVKDCAAGFIEGVIADDDTVVGEFIDGFEVFPLFAGILGVPVIPGVDGQRGRRGRGAEDQGRRRRAENMEGLARDAFEKGGHGVPSNLKGHGVARSEKAGGHGRMSKGEPWLTSGGNCAFVHRSIGSVELGGGSFFQTARGTKATTLPGIPLSKRVGKESAGMHELGQGRQR
jgi:hypothetical protein